MNILFLGIGSLILTTVAFAELPSQPLSHTKNAQEATKPDERGTEQMPLIIKVLPSLNENEKAATEKQEHEDKSKSDWWLVKLTGVLAGIGGLQLIVFGLQARRLRQTIREMEKSTEIARQEFNATHRPRLVVRRISPIEERGDIAIGLQYTVHNVGDIDGTIVAVSETVWLPDNGQKALPPIPAYSPPVAKNITLKCGEWITISHIPGNDALMDINFRTGFREEVATIGISEEPSNILFLGYIDYIDGTGRKRQTAYLRQLDLAAKRFSPINHPEYEYQD